MQTWLLRHVQTLVGSLGRLAHQPLANILTTAVIGLALALPACLYALMSNARNASSDWNNALDISVYLKAGVSSSEAAQVAERIRKRRDVGAADLIKAEDALVEFKQHSGFGAALEALTTNPLPHAVVVHPSTEFRTPAHLATLTAQLQALPEVDLVQLDTAWVQRFYAILDFIRRAVALAAVLLGVGVVAIVGNTIRLDIQNRREEIEVTKLIGGSNAFVRRPFLYTGVWYGLGGGVIAWLTTLLVIGTLGGAVRRLAGLYGSQFHLSGLEPRWCLVLILGAAVLGWMGSWVATSVHLHRIEPR